MTGLQFRILELEVAIHAATRRSNRWQTLFWLALGSAIAGWFR